MMDGWTYRKLRDVVSFVNDGDWIESRHQSENGIRLIQTGNIGDGVFKAKDDKPHYISEETFSLLGCTEVIEGDCLVSRLPDPVGRACIIPNIGSKMITAVDCTILRFKPSMLPAFFVYYSRSKQYHREIANNTTGTTRKRISRKNLESVNVPSPPLSEQEHIVAEFDLLSRILDNQKAQLKELDTLAQSVFYNMFGDPAENEKGWQIKRLGDVCVIERGGSPRPIDKFITDDEDGVNWIKIGDATEGGMVINSTKERITREGAKKSRFVHKGDFLLSNSMSFGKPYILGVDGCIHDGWLVIRDENNVFDKIYLYYFLGSPQTYEAFKNMAVGGVVNNLNKDIVKKVQVAIPSRQAQESFAQKIQAIEKQKETINKAIKETQTLFDYTMDKFFG